YGDPSVSSTDFDVRVAVITRLYFSHALTDQCPEPIAPISAFLLPYFIATEIFVKNVRNLV
ncbi:MAG: hypothetical protein ACKPCM_19455, partial [Pseudanabaena sp.]